MTIITVITVITTIIIVSVVMPRAQQFQLPLPHCTLGPGFRPIIIIIITALTLYYIAVHVYFCSRVGLPCHRHCPSAPTRACYCCAYLALVQPPRRHQHLY